MRNTIPKVVRRRRRGFTLVQTITVFSCAAVLLSLVVGILNSLMRVQVAQQDAIRLVHLRTRLARTFREDVHAANRVELAPQTGGLVLKGPAGVTTYRSEERRLVRESTAPGLQTRYETWPLDLVRIEFATDAAEKPSMVSLQMRTINKFSPKSTVPQTTHEDLITARLARDMRFNVKGAP